MASIIKPKFSSTAAAVPTTSDLADGEFCINTVDKIIYQRVGAAIIAVANYFTGGGITWTEVTTTSQTMAVDSGYISNNSSLVLLTLPTTAAVGKIINVNGSGAGGWRIAQNANQVIKWTAGGVAGTNETTTGTGGKLESSDRYDAVAIQCIAANNVWTPMWSKGNIILT